jgi:hypothetical protein
VSALQKNLLPVSYTLKKEIERFLETLVATKLYGVIFENNQLDAQFFFMAARNM